MPFVAAEQTTEDGQAVRVCLAPRSLKLIGNPLGTERVRVDEIDSVFLTGGSSFIPPVRRVFEERFGAYRLADGEHFQSVAFGFALIGLEDDLDPWLAHAPCG